MTRNVKCPICGTDALAHLWNDEHGGQRGEAFDCRRCARFVMTLGLSRELERSRPAWWFRLSAWVRERNEQGEEFFEIQGTPGEIEAALPTRTFTEQLDLLLQLIADRTPTLGSVLELDVDRTAPLVWAKDGAEVEALLWHLRGLDRLVPSESHFLNHRVVLATAGLLRLEELASSAAANERIFVAMWFPPPDHEEHAKMGAAYTAGLSAAIEAAGYRPFRIDDAPLTEHRIDARIMVDIRRARAVVADATGHRASVLYEAGFAEGLGKPVIWTVREDYLKGLPFDTRQFPHLVWASPEQLARDLQPRIENRLGIRTR